MPSVYIESLPITEYAANTKPIAIHNVTPENSILEFLLSFIDILFISIFNITLILQLSQVIIMSETTLNITCYLHS